MTHICKMKNLLLTIFSLAVLTACKEKKNVDVYTPSIDAFAINGSTETTQNYIAADTITLSFSMSDNQSLRSYTINIHPAADGHTHTGNGSSGGEWKLPAGQWNVYEEVAVNSAYLSSSKSYVIPDSISGIWHVVLTTTDDFGLSASKAFSLIIENPNAPEIVLTSVSPTIDADGKIHAQPGGSIQLHAHAYDPDGLQSVNIKLYSGSGQLLNTSSVPVSGTTVDFPANFNQASLGTYHIAIEARDLLGFMRVWDVLVIVH